MKRLLKPLSRVFLWVLFVGLLSGAAPASAASPAARVADLIKASLVDVTPGQMQWMMANHFRRLRLLDDKGQWNAPELARIGDRLLPDNIDPARAGAFLDRVVQLAETNGYLVDFLNKASRETFPDLAAKVAREGNAVFPDVVAYAIALENLTKAMYDDWRVIKACRGVWRVERKKAGIFRHMSLFDMAKLPSVENAVRYYIEFPEKGHPIPARYGREGLAINIWEAVAVDTRLGNLCNAHTGKILNDFPCGAKEYDPRTGEGPTIWSKDGKGFLYRMALPRLWADLYGNWNLSFVSHYDDFPYLFAKLLIPQVQDYAAEPGVYIYNRALALYVHLHFLYLGRADHSQARTETIKWTDKKRTRFWGKVNLQNARLYKAAVKKARSQKKK